MKSSLVDCWRALNVFRKEHPSMALTCHRSPSANRIYSRRWRIWKPSSWWITGVTAVMEIRPQLSNALMVAGSLQIRSMHYINVSFRRPPVSIWLIVTEMFWHFWTVSLKPCMSRAVLKLPLKAMTRRSLFCCRSESRDVVSVIYVMQAEHFLTSSGVKIHGIHESKCSIDLRARLNGVGVNGRLHSVQNHNMNVKEIMTLIVGLKRTVHLALQMSRYSFWTPKSQFSALLFWNAIRFHA